MPLSLLTVRSAFAMLSVTAVVSVAAVALVGKPAPVQAYPQYAQSEGVKCGYCHVRAAGGGPRNYRGKFYKKNSLTFANFDDAAEAKAAGEPVAPEADAKPKSLTLPAGGGTTPTVEPSPVAPVPSPSPSPSQTAVEVLRKNAADAAAALKKTPKSVPAKKAYSASLTKLARGIMNDATIKPAVKYPEALRLSRQAVALDPTNKDAALDVKRIVDVYKQMGRPVPK